MKFPVTPAGIETATFRFVSQHLNHCATAVLHQEEKKTLNSTNGYCRSFNHFGPRSLFVIYED